MDFKERAFQMREVLKEYEQTFRDLAMYEPEPEVAANVVLAFRHLEDCRMRLGKAIQAFDGGVSVYAR